MGGVESVLAEVTLGPAPDVERLRALCLRHDVSVEDADALVDGLPRLVVYRELVRGNLQEALRLSIPRTIARLGPEFEAYFDRFVAERAPRSHYLRDVTPELLDFCAPLWERDSSVPAYLVDLARHEALHLQVSALPTPPVGHVAAGLALDLGVTLSAAVRLVQYRHAVHELPEDVDDRTEPSRRTVALLVYRSPEHDVRYLELSSLAHAIVEQLSSGQTLGAAIRGAAAAEGAALTEAVLSGAAQLLADLAERGVVWGPAARPG